MPIIDTSLLPVLLTALGLGLVMGSVRERQHQHKGPMADMCTPIYRQHKCISLCEMLERAPASSHALQCFYWCAICARHKRRTCRFLTAEWLVKCRHFSSVPSRNRIK